jgi:hypothetical protein
MLEVVIDAGFIASLNVTFRLVLVETPVDLAEGVNARIVGATSELLVVNVQVGSPAKDAPARSRTPVDTETV